MFSARKTERLAAYSDPDEIKLYAISASGAPVDPQEFVQEWEDAKRRRAVNWSKTPAFGIFHAGASMLYVVLCWWGNGNELFTAVSVREEGRWIEDRNRFSFCIWDLQVMWFERNSFIKHLYSGAENLAGYRADFYQTRDGHER